MHVDEFIFNCCVSSMISDDMPEQSTECAMNVFSIDENKIRDANGIIFAEAITCYKCTFCGKMFAAMEVVLTHYQSNHRCSVIPLLKGMARYSAPKLKTPKPKPQSYTTQTSSVKSKEQMKTSTENQIQSKTTPKRDLRARPNTPLTESAVTNGSRLLRESTKTIKTSSETKKVNKKKYNCSYPGCSKAFTYPNGLETHQKSHKKLKSYKCVWNDCKFKCSDLAGMAFHKKTHSGDNPYMCSWPGCDASFSDATAKDQHLQRQHIKDKILLCDYPGCDAQFDLALERDRHKATHLGKKISDPHLKIVYPVRRSGRPPAKRSSIIISSSSSEESEESSDESEVEEEDKEGFGEGVENKNETNVEKSLEEIKNEPLDLSKTSTDLKAKATEEVMTETKTPSKRGRKPKKSLDKPIAKAVFRCDYPGCRKTFPDGSLLKEHERDTHNTQSADGRSRYERRCKGNLYYKL